MRTRQIPREVPDRAPYIKIEIGRGVHQMKAPSLHSMATLLGAASGLATVLAAIEGGVSDVRGAVDVLARGGPDLLSALGALIGLGWAHEVLDLETENAGNVLEYGAAVYEELHSAGYSLDDIAGLGLGLLAAVWDQTKISEETRNRAAFFQKTPEVTPH
jgi:hypothetical protein